MKKLRKYSGQLCWCVMAACLMQAANAQTRDGYLLWSATHRLTVDDFAIKTGQLESVPSSAQFMIDYEVGGFSFFTKNFNKKVRNYFLKSASWIDTSSNVMQSLIYQQTLFNIAEVYTRQFRRALQDNRKQFLKGTAVAEDLNRQYMAAFAERRVAYDRETVFGASANRQQAWEKQIKKELQELDEFAYDK